LVSTVAAAALDSRTTAAALDSAAATAAFVAAALDSKALVSSAAVAAAMCAGAGADNREETSSSACGCFLSHAGNGGPIDGGEKPPEEGLLRLVWCKVGEQHCAAGFICGCF